MTGCLCHQNSALTHQLSQPLDGTGQQASAVIGNPHQPITDTLGGYPLPVLHIQARHKGICIAIVILVSFREIRFLIGLLLNLIPQIPKHVRYRFTTLKQVSIARQIGSETAHIRPPGLLTQERRPDTSAKRGPRLILIRVGIVRVSMKDHMRYPIQDILVGHFAQHTQMLIPVEVKTCESLGRHTRLAIHTCGRGSGTDRFVVSIVEPMAHGLPKLRHRHVGPLVILHRTTGKDIASGRLVLNRHTIPMGILCHSSIEIVHKQAVLRHPEIVEKLRSLLRIVYYVTKQGRNPCLQFVTRLPTESLRHAISPRL